MPEVKRDVLEEAEYEAEKYWEKLGPGLTTGAADDDPSGIATYSQAGAQTGFQFLWLALFTFPLMAVVQEMCARIGLVTGKGLAANIRAHYPRWALYLTTLLLFVTNTFNIGVNLGAMAEATRLLFPQFNFLFLVFIFAGISIVLEIFTTYRTYARYLKYCALILLSYIISGFLMHLDWSEALFRGLIPSFDFNKESLLLVTAVLGTTISPYLFFWQTSQEVEEEIMNGKTTVASRFGTNPRELQNMRFDVWAGMFISNLVMFFIIATCAAALNANGITNIVTAADAAEALRPLAGESAYLLFAVGIIGIGFLSVPVLAGGAAYAIAESFRWKEGLYRKFKNAHAFYGVIIIATVLGFLMNLLGFDPIQALIWCAVLNGLIAPFVLFFIVRLSGSEKIMGKWKNTAMVQGIGWFVTLAMAVVGIATLWSLW